MEKMTKASRFYLLFILMMTAAVLASCGGNSDGDNSEAKNDSNEDVEGFPVTIENSGREMKFEEPPERVVALYQQEAELFAALGLEDKVVGYSIVTEDTPDEYKDQIEEMDVISEDDYPSKEVMLEKDPDFVIGSERTFQDNGVGSIEELDELGIDAYATESEKPETVDNMVYKQIEEISEIFGVEDRGDELIEDMKADIDEITEKVDDVDDPVKVLVMSGGESSSAQVSGGASLDSYLVELAGGENVFADEDEYLFEASWEEIVERDPDVIVTSFCCGTGPDDLEKVLENSDSMKDVTAVKENNYVAAQVEDTTGNVRVTRGLEKLAKGFYPDKFD